VSNTVLNLAWQVDGLTSAEKLVLVALADRADEAGFCWPSLADIARRCCVSERYARTTLRGIEAAGHVTTQRSAGPGGANRFQVHPRFPASSPDTRILPGSPRPSPQKQGSPSPGSLVPLPPDLRVRQTLREPSRNPLETSKPSVLVSAYQDALRRSEEEGGQ
jgi:hypothetical protein